MAEVHQFTYGVFNPIAAGLLGFIGSFLGLQCTARARAARTRSRRTRWLVIAAFAIGGAAIWLMHFAAILGFDVPASPVRYDLAVAAGSLVIAVVTVGIGLMIAGHGRRSVSRTLLAGLVTGGGVVAMHYSGMAGLNIAGTMHYDPGLVAASALIAVLAATLALWFAVSVDGWARISGAAAVMAVAVCGMHYTAMAAMSVHLTAVPPGGGERDPAAHDDRADHGDQRGHHPRGGDERAAGDDRRGVHRRGRYAPARRPRRDHHLLVAATGVDRRVEHRVEHRREPAYRRPPALPPAGSAAPAGGGRPGR